VIFENATLAQRCTENIGINGVGIASAHGGDNSAGLHELSPEFEPS
jgi:hypothetical protein